MTFVVTENCIKCKYTDCVEVCPVDCFYEGPNFLVIHPDECIDCALCEPECPVDAIKSEDDLTDNDKKFLEINDELSRQWPNINVIKEAPADADDWKEAGEQEDRRTPRYFASPPAKAHQRGRPAGLARRPPGADRPGAASPLDRSRP